MTNVHLPQLVYLISGMPDMGIYPINLYIIDVVSIVVAVRLL